MRYFHTHADRLGSSEGPLWNQNQTKAVGVRFLYVDTERRVPSEAASHVSTTEWPE